MRGDYNIIGINLPKMIMFAFYCFRYYYYYFAQEIFYNITTCFLNLSNSISRSQLLRLLAIVLKFRQQDQTPLSSPVAVELHSGGYTYIGIYCQEPGTTYLYPPPPILPGCAVQTAGVGESNQRRAANRT